MSDTECEKCEYTRVVHQEIQMVQQKLIELRLEMDMLQYYFGLMCKELMGEKCDACQVPVPGLRRSSTK
jgi:hypothetical protein